MLPIWMWKAHFVPSDLMGEEQEKYLADLVKKLFQGPTQLYDRLGMQHLYLPFLDHTVPSLGFLEQGVAFLQHYHNQQIQIQIQQQPDNQTTQPW